MSLPVSGFDPFGNPGGMPGIPAPSVVFADPTDLEPLLNVAIAQIELNNADGVRLNVSAGGVLLATTPTSGIETVTLDLDLTPVPNGNAELLAELFDSDDDVIGSATVTVVVTHPTLALTPMAADNTFLLELEGMDEDLFYIVLAADVLETSYFPNYDVELPLDSARAAVMAMGAFGPGYGGDTVALEFDLSTSSADQLHFVVITYTVHGAWVPSNLVTVDID